MNVRVCTFPEGEDPDSFAKKTSYENLILYLEDNAKDFIQFKASLLMNEAKNDPIKKAELIRDMVTSISKIPDRIKREIYIQECSRIMDISEQVLLNTLAQLVQKDVTEAGKKIKQEQKAFEVVKNENAIAIQKVDILYELERKIIEILLLYGDKMEEFEDVILKANEEGEIEEVSEKKEYKVFQRIYLSLQEDEVELANPLFLGIYNQLIQFFLQNEVFNLEEYLMHLSPEFAQEVTNIIMENELNELSNWEGRNVFVKMKDVTTAQYVSETILSIRWYLVGQLVEELKQSLTKETESDNTEFLKTTMDYNGLINSFSKKLGRVLSRYS